MTTIWQDGFSHYGVDAPNAAPVAAANMQDGAWAIATGTCGAPAWGARTGAIAYKTGTQDDGQGGANTATRRVFNASLTAAIISLGFSVDNLPNGNNFYILKPRTGANSSAAGIRLRTDGVLIFESPLGTQVGVTQAPVIRARTWHALEMKFDPTGHTFRLDVDGVTVMTLTGVAYKDEQGNALATVEQLAIGCGTVPGVAMAPWYSDLIVRSTAGAQNNDFEGDVRVVTLFPDADAPTQGWTRRALRNVGAGVAANLLAQSGCSIASTTKTNLGAGDFTIEGFYRFLTVPTASNIASLFGKWDAGDNLRSYQLYLQGPGLGGNLSLRYSTNGQAGTVFDAITWPFIPDTNRWYHVAVVRSAGELLLFIDGVQQGLPVPDATVPFVGSAPTSFGGQVEGIGGNASAGTALNGWMDELRLTVGFARYTANFTPTTVPFGRNATDDPEFADVQVLCGFDNASLADESQNGFTVRNSPTFPTVPVLPQDGDFNFQDINSATPQDFTFIEAALTPASSIFTQTAQPAPGEHVTVGTVSTGPAVAAVYTFRAALAGAYDILIGATVQDTLANLRQAINLGPGAGTAYGAGTLINNDVSAAGLPSDQMQVTAGLPGTGGNAIATSTTAADGSWPGATLAGGQNIPGPSEFYFQRPPPDTTVVKSVTIITRSFKDDNGTCSLQASFVGPLNGASLGADNALTIAPSYREDIFEVDPDTGDPLSPTSITSGRVRLNRTA